MKITQKDITRIIELTLGKKPIAPEEPIIEAYGAESADIANIVVALENKYRVQIAESELAKLHTPGDFYQVVVDAARSP